MTKFNTELELLQIGGAEKYNYYLARMKSYIRENPNNNNNEVVIHKATGVPLIAIRKAVREGSLVEKKISEDEELLKKKAAWLSAMASMKSAEKKPDSKLVADLVAQRRRK